MLTISLDEQGDFENMKNENAPIFIGGIIYNDRELENEHEYEKKRVSTYLQRVCMSVGAKYPRDLHFYKYANGGNNSNKVRLVKQRIRETLSEFMQAGTFEGCELIFSKSGEALKRLGDYHIFIMLKSTEGKRSLLGDNISDLINDTYAGNLYVHMAEDVVSRVIFHNPVITNIGRVRVELATRRVVLEGADRNIKLQEYLKIGYREDKEHSTDSEKVIMLTNTDNYRTTLEREMLDTDKKNILIDRISVKSIYYEHKKANMEFLHLSDVICSMLGFEPDGNNPEEWLEEFYKKISDYTGHDKNLIFSYDTIDTFYKKAYEAYENGDYYKALSFMFDGSRLNTKVSGFYDKIWFKSLKEKIIACNNISAYIMAVKKFHASVFNNNIIQDKLLFVYNVLSEAKNNLNFENTDEQIVLYDLYDAAVATFCNIGDVKNARLAYKACKKYARFVGIERYLRTRNKLVVMLMGSFLYDEALEIARENLTYHEEFLLMRKKLFKDDALDDSIGHAITLSQLGQVYAAKRMSEAEEVFKQALSELEQGSANYFITQSYLLHHYIDMGDKLAYDKMAVEYFGGNIDYEKQFEYIVEEGSKERNAIISLKYAMFVFLKGIYNFHMADITGSFLNKLLNLEKGIKKISSAGLKQINGHPWELIYKYLAFMAFDKGRNELVELYNKKMCEIVSVKGQIIKIMELFGKAQLADRQGNMELREVYSKEALLIICANDERVKVALSDDNMSFYKQLDEIMTYMYR